jgi:hypothetical protein
MDPDVRRLIFIPMVLLLGMVIAGAIVDSQLHTGNTFALIFVAFGGVPALGYYFYKELFKE